MVFFKEKSKDTIYTLLKRIDLEHLISKQVEVKVGWGREKNVVQNK